MDLTLNGKISPILVETCALEGVKRIGARIAADIECILPDSWRVISEKDLPGENQLILCATVGESPLLDCLEKEGKICLEAIKGKREVFQIQIIKSPFEGVEEALLICGSDKRGTIYGMFTFSEYIGVSPLCYWGDVAPVRKEKLFIEKDIEIISKEPSVKYRGFFINDEWPCFGNWAGEHFGGFNASVYEQVFEFLLRMKGNYLWPAMWSASFPLDGPGSANEELADIYGVVMGYSHHEPCLRASEEWDKVRGADSVYGNEWNFYTNEEGLLKYWEDALKRSGKFENIITIGMRGERDTSMLGENSSVTENIELLKRIITKQRELISRHVNKDLKQVPQLLALYKEVEEYFYGNEETEGLKSWRELDGVICMLCEDNFGHMRSLPTEEIRNRQGGFGMYYHFDYHGGPISYEWVDSTPLSKTWEQMCMAYEYGIKDVWIVNVGDLKLHEVPLTYFMALAYDYEKWGYSNRNSYTEYVEQWVNNTFKEAEPSIKKGIKKVFTDYIAINGKRRPEALNDKVYHPCHYLETDRMLALAREIDQTNDAVYQALNEREKTAYYSMIYFSAKASMNLLKMHLYAGKNEHYAKQGKKIANEYGDKVAECILKDRQLAEEFAGFQDGKWKGMELASHIGFVKWNEDDYRYPIIQKIEPAHKPRLKVSRKDSGFIGVKNYGPKAQLMVDDFLYEGCEEVIIEVANDGIGEVEYTISVDSPKGVLPPWLTISKTAGKVAVQDEILLVCDRSMLTPKKEEVSLLIQDAETCVEICIQAQGIKKEQVPPMTFFPQNKVIVMDASHYAKLEPAGNSEFKVISGYGKHGNGLKVFPSTCSFQIGEDSPKASYQFFMEEAGEYQVELCLAPSNPVSNKQKVHLLLENSAGKKVVLQVIDEQYRPGESSDPEWSKGVLNQEKRKICVMSFEKGVGNLTISPLEPGVVLEKIRIYPVGMQLKPSYLGPLETYYTR